MGEEQDESNMDRRSYERVDVELDVRWRRLAPEQAHSMLNRYLQNGALDVSALGAEVEDPQGMARTQNLSFKGLRLQDGSDLAEGWELLMEILAPDQDQPIRALAAVIWVTPPGLGPCQAGLFFKAIGGADGERISRLMAVAKGDGHA